MKQLIALFTCFLLLGCKKDKQDPNPSDFRAKYIGKYQCKFTLNCYGSCGNCSSEKDSIVIVKKGLTDTTFMVLGRDVFLDDSGNYSTYHYGLRLWNDSLQSNFMNGGLACGQYENFLGYKISNDTL